MTIQAINLQLPPAIYQHLADAAEASQQSLTDMILQSIRISLPPTLSHVPERFRDDLKGLYQLGDEILWKVTEQDLTTDKAQQYEELLTKNQQGALGQPEQNSLEILREEADLLMLRRSYAYALLKWRGFHPPT
jgi:hypothetical protein